MSPLSLPNEVAAPHTLVDPRLGRAFAAFVTLTDHIVRAFAANEVELCARLKDSLALLVADNRWIPAELTAPAHGEYRRECLYEAHDGAFSIGVFTWVPGHTSRIHDHHSWAVLGNMTGTLRSENFLSVTPGLAFKHTTDDLLEPGTVLWSTQATGDIHRVSVASSEKSTSIHIYGCRFDAVNRDYYTEQLPETNLT